MIKIILLGALLFAVVYVIAEGEDLRNNRKR